MPRDRIAGIDRRGTLSYGDLHDGARALAEQLGSSRRLVILECDPDNDWLVAYVATQMGGHPALLSPPGATPAQARFCRDFRVHATLRSERGYAPDWHHSDALAMHPELGLLLSTSGSTGSPKCVRLSRRNLASNAEAIALYLRLSETERGVVNLPTYYSYGLSVVNSHLWAGATLLFPGESVTDTAFWDFCRDHGATSLIGVPHTYDLLSRIDFETLAPPGLRYLTQAGGRLAPEKVEAVARMSERRGWRFYVMYGQTEAAPRMAYMPPERLLASPGSIGVAIPGGRLSIRDDAGQELPPDTEGELVYEGPNVMMGYAFGADGLAGEPELTMLRTGDMAQQSEDGLFFITGRMSRFVKIFGNRIGLDEIEAICDAAGHEAIATGIDGKILVITRTAGTEAAIAAHLAATLKLPPHTIEVRYMAEYPVLPTGKIDYARLKASIHPEGEESKPAARVSDIYERVFGDAGADENRSFLDLGGDSLTFVQVALDLEPLIGTLPDNWPEMPACDLQALVGAAPRPVNDGKPDRRFVLGKADTLRAVACLLVVMLHVFGADSNSGLHVPTDSPWRFPFEMFDLLRMPLFTALAGLLYGAMPAIRVGVGPFLRQRALSLALPGVVVSLIYFGLRSAMGQETAELVPALLNGHLHLWYIYALFVIVACVGVIDVLLHPGVRLWLAVAIGLSLLRFVMPWMGVLSINPAIALAPYFILGLILYRRPDILGNRALLATLAVVALVGVGVHAGVLTGAIQQRSTPALWVIPLASAALIVLAARFMPRIRLLEWLGLYSYAIYLWHPLSNAAWRTILGRLGMSDPVILFLTGTIAGVVLPIGIYGLLERSPKFLRNSLIGR